MIFHSIHRQEYPLIIAVGFNYKTTFINENSCQEPLILSDYKTTQYVVCPFSNLSVIDPPISVLVCRDLTRQLGWEGISLETIHVLPIGASLPSAPKYSGIKRYHVHKDH